MNVIINTPIFLEAMRAKGWTNHDTCVMCRVHYNTLAKILAGRMPKRLDAFYRLVTGLGIDMKEALIATAPHEAQRAQIHILPGRLPTRDRK